VTRDASSARSTPPEVAARRVDAATSGLPFSTGQDASESGARDDEARGRQASAMSARLAAAVASTSEQPSSARSATPSHVFAIPGVATTTSHAVTATVEAHAATPALAAENIDRLVRAMHVNVRSGVMEATVTLRPEHFGEVTIQLRVDGTNVTALVQTESSGVRQWLESQEQAIRNGLAAHGLELDRLVVNPDGEQQQARDDSEANASRRRAYRRRQQSAERFEITV
jgi:flagellar hook-length control protein FliK